jgi:Fe-S cluster biogenesis protein NfuA
MSDQQIRQQVQEQLPEILTLLQFEGLQVEILAVDRGVVEVRLNGSCNG